MARSSRAQAATSAQAARKSSIPSVSGIIAEWRKNVAGFARKSRAARKPVRPLSPIAVAIPNTSSGAVVWTASGTTRASESSPMPVVS